MNEMEKLAHRIGASLQGIRLAQAEREYRREMEKEELRARHERELKNAHERRAREMNIRLILREAGEKGKKNATRNKSKTRS